MKDQRLIALLLMIMGSHAGFIVKTPERLMPGENATVCVVSNDIQTPVGLGFALMSADPAIERRTYAEARLSLSSRATGCAALALPKGVRGSFVLLMVQARASDGYSFGKRDRPGMLFTGVREMFIKTDKLAYSPGQTVELLVATMTADFTPEPQQVYDIWIEDPTGVQVKQWFNATNKNGVVELSFKLADKPTFGVWTVNSASDQMRKKLTFRVDEYDFHYKIFYSSNSRDANKNSSDGYWQMAPSRRGIRPGDIRQQPTLSFRSAGLPVCPVCAEPVSLSSLCSSKHVYMVRLVAASAKPQLHLVAELRGRDQIPRSAKNIYGSVAPECNCTLLSSEANGSMLIIAHDFDLGAKARGQNMTLDLSTGNSIIFALRPSAERILRQQMKRCIRHGEPLAAWTWS